VFQRFTEGARQAVMGAQDDARTLGHDAIGPEHLLLGLLRADGIAAEVLTGQAFSIDLETARALVTEELGPGTGTRSERMPFTPEGKRALEAAQTTMESWEHDHIDTEHLLFGLLVEAPTPTQRILFGLHADPSRVQAELADRVWRGEPRERVFPAFGNPVERRAREIALRYAGATPSGRVPDSGDLLLGFFEAGHGIAARALAELGIRQDALREAVEKARREVGPDVRATEDESGGP
jgi:ATP-dependent Clp protease ATP-binding subunit ClpA